MPDNYIYPKLPLSVSVIAYNEEKIIARMLESIKDIASEIVVVIDSDSSDNTAEIAKSFGARIYHEDWKGFMEQKNSALKKCRYDWVLFLDADEVPSDELKQSIIEKVNNPDFDSYYMERKTYYLGKLLDHAWQPDRNLRLANKKSNPVWMGGIVHESLQVDSDSGILDGILVHYSYRDISHHFSKTIEYARVSAKSYHLKGKKFKSSNLLLNPIFAFVKQYFLNRGFMDGFRGFVAAFSSFVYTFLKYAFLWELYNRTVIVAVNDDEAS